MKLSVAITGLQKEKFYASKCTELDVLINTILIFIVLCVGNGKSSEIILLSVG